MKKQDDSDNVKLIIIVIMLFLLIVFVFSGCITEKKRAEICSTCPVKTEVRDSIIERIKEIPFDTTIWLAKHTGKEQSFTNCDSLFYKLAKFNNRLQTDSNGIKSIIEKKGNRITFRCEADSLRQVIKLLKYQKDRVQVKTVVKEVPARCDKDHKTWLDGLYKRGFWILLSVIAGFFGFKYLKGKVDILKKSVSPR